MRYDINRLAREKEIYKFWIKRFRAFQGGPDVNDQLSSPSGTALFHPHFKKELHKYY